MTDTIYIIISALLGLLVGSFLNVVIYRLPQMTVSGIVRYGKSLGFLALPFSYCPHCQTQIPPYYNIPIISFLWLRGKSKCCQKPISRCYPLIEIFTTLMFIAALNYFGWTINFVFANIFICTLIIISVIDMRRYLIFDILTLSLLWLGLLINIDARFAILNDAVLGAAGGYLVMYCLAAAGKFIFQKTVIGYGDFKLVAALGAWLGWQPLPLLLFLACIIGIVYAFVVSLVRVLAGGKTSSRKMRWRKFMQSPFHFGPALSLAGVIMLFKADDIITAYLIFIKGN